MELNKVRPDVILFDSIMAHSHVALPSRRALGWGWEDWLSFGVEVALGIAGLFVRRNLDAAVVAHFEYGNIVDMCEMPAESIVKQFQFLCLGEAECEVSVKDLNQLLKNNHAKPVTGC